MSSSEPNPEFERITEELLRGMPGGFPTEMQAMDSLDVGGTASVQQEYDNARELIQSSPGIRLSTFALGTDLVLTTASTLEGREGHLRVKLVPWAGQEKIEPSENVRAFVAESNIGRILPETEIQINGPSIGQIMLDSTHNGEIRASCNLMVTPIKLVEACKTDVAADKFKELLKDGLIELAERGPLAGRYVIPDIMGVPVVLPEVLQLDRVHPDYGFPEPQKWLPARALES